MGVLTFQRSVDKNAMIDRTDSLYPHSLLYSNFVDLAGACLCVLCAHPPRHRLGLGGIYFLIANVNFASAVPDALTVTFIVCSPSFSCTAASV